MPELSFSDLSFYLAGVLLIAGSVFAIGGAVGVLRFPDVFARMHAASKAGIAGSGLALIAVALAAADLGFSSRALLALAFFMLTTPLSAHLLARAVFRSRAASLTDKSAMGNNTDDSLS